MHARSEPNALVRALDEACGLVDVAYLHACSGLNDPTAFRALLRFLESGVWAVNLGELQFEEEQLRLLLQCVKASDITHMFYECDALPPGRKDEFLAAIRSNRSKHDRWVIKPGRHAMNLSISNCTHMWFNPAEHTVNGGRRRSAKHNV